jgi:hypothetical protein
MFQILHIFTQQLAGISVFELLKGNEVRAIKSQKRFIQGYRELLLVGAILFNFSNIACVNAKNPGVTTRSENDIDRMRNPTSFDADQFALSGCNDTLLRDMKKKNVVPKSMKFDNETAAYEYQSADAIIFIPKEVNLHNDGKFILLYSIVTNLRAFDFTKPFYGKTLSEVEGFFKANFNGSKSVSYKVNPSKKSITLDTEATDIEFHSNKDRINRIDFQCSNNE